MVRRFLLFQEPSSDDPDTRQNFHDGEPHQDAGNEIPHIGSSDRP